MLTPIVAVPSIIGNAEDSPVKSVRDKPVTVVGLLVILDHAGVIVTVVPTDVILPLASTVNGLTVVPSLLYVPAVTPLVTNVKAAVAVALPSKDTDQLASPDADIVAAAASLVAVLAFPVNAPANVGAVTVPVNVGDAVGALLVSVG